MAPQDSKAANTELAHPFDGMQSPSSASDVIVDHGTPQDDLDMIRLGKRQQLHRHFQSTSILGLVCLTLGTWMGMLTTATFSLINGGRAGTIWVYIATWLCSTAVVASMAEMASMAPSSGGQYHWVSEFAPPSTQKLLSYIVGWLSALGWQAFVAVSAYQAGALILVLASEGNPSYTPLPYHNTFMTIAIAVFAVLMNIYGARILPTFEKTMLFFHVAGFFAILIPLWVLAPKAPTSQVWGEFSNFGGWSSVGAACVVGQLTAAAEFIGADSAAHMAEEIRNFSLTVPHMMMAAVVLNGVLGLVMIVTFVYCVQDLQVQIVDSTAVYPFIGVFKDATGSSAAAIGMAVSTVILSTSMAVNAVAAASRQGWSFARDQGMLSKSCAPESADNYT